MKKRALKVKVVEGFEDFGDTVEVREPSFGDVKWLLEPDLDEADTTIRLITTCVYIDGQPVTREELDELPMREVTKFMEIGVHVKECLGIDDEKND